MSILRRRGCAPACSTHAPAPEPKYAQVTVVPSKNAGPRAKSDAPAIPRAARAEDQQAVNEAYTLPYAAPIFDIKKAEADPAKELALRALCRRRLLPFVQRFRPKYLAGWVHEDICRRLERFVRAVEAGESPRLLLLLPPRSGKSELGSRNFPPWVLGQHPDWEIIAASHTQSLTLSFSRYVRDLVRDPAYKAIFPDLMLDPASQSIENWNTLQGGGYMAAGVGTGISGRGCFSRNTLLRSHTLSDILPISHVRVGEMVYGYDHRTGCVKEVEVLAISLMRTRKQLYAIEDVVCTDDHYFHTPDERSYTRARALDSNMSLLRRTEVQGVENVPCVLLPEPADTLDWQGMPEVRGQEGRPRIRVQKLPHGASTSRPHRDSDLHALRKDVRAESSRARGAIRKYGGLATFCSMECYQAHPKPATKVRGQCEGCGAPLKKWDQKKYCSHTCYLDTKKARSTKTTYNQDYSTLKKLLINQKDRACAMCEQKTYRVEVHHIDHDPEHNKVGNLVLLCSRCHKSYHTLAESVQETLKPLFRTKTASL